MKHKFVICGKHYRFPRLFSKRNTSHTLLMSSDHVVWLNCERIAINRERCESLIEFVDMMMFETLIYSSFKIKKL